MELRLVNHRGRAGVLVGAVAGGHVADLGVASGGALPADPMAALAAWDDVRAWAREADDALATEPCDPDALGPCVPQPRQVFALGLNYRRHATEGGMPVPPEPLVFTKFPSCLAGPRAPVPRCSDTVDWEVELVVVIGRGGRDIDEADAMAHVAGCCVGQDFSDRTRQFSGTPPQFSMAKSSEGFGPIGPAVVDRELVGDCGDLRLWCAVNGEVVQDDRTSDLIFTVPVTIAHLSRICRLEPGDVVFTGTPAGVGAGRTPPRFLQVGDVVTSGIDGLGELENRVVGS